MPDAPREIANCPDFTVLDETADYIVVSKPAPLLVHPAKPGNPPTLLDGLEALLAFEMANGARLSIINRLDRETSGLVLVAKNLPTARDFHKAMERRQARKEYLAIVWGWPEEDVFRVEAPLLRRGEVEPSPVWLMQCVHPDGAPSRTEFVVERRLEREGTRFSLIRALPHTGRMHQIRLHLRHAGFGVVGDKLYGRSEAFYLQHIETGWTPELASALLLPRHALHSCMLELPVEGRMIRWESPLAADLQAFLQTASTGKS
ncbi:MAG: RluA family pseudouridine synthase [Verrucomicrobiales bacterium]|nr:RluA family pseudouridine synthase [Verrucomicrobiales bacterium]